MIWVLFLVEGSEQSLERSIVADSGRTPQKNIIFQAGSGWWGIKATETSISASAGGGALTSDFKHSKEWIELWEYS